MLQTKNWQQRCFAKPREKWKQVEENCDDSGEREKKSHTGKWQLILISANVHLNGIYKQLRRVFF